MNACVGVAERHVCRADVRDEDIHLTPDELPLEQWRPDGIDTQAPLQVSSRPSPVLVVSGADFSSGEGGLSHLQPPHGDGVSHGQTP